MESVRLEGWQGLDLEGFVGHGAEFDFILMVGTAGHLRYHSRAVSSFSPPAARSAGC